MLKGIAAVLIVGFLGVYAFLWADFSIESDGELAMDDAWQFVRAESAMDDWLNDSNVNDSLVKDDADLVADIEDPTPPATFQFQASHCSTRENVVTHGPSASGFFFMHIPKVVPSTFLFYAHHPLDRLPTSSVFCSTSVLRCTGCRLEYYRYIGREFRRLKSVFL
jgi:hypothetical protein